MPHLFVNRPRYHHLTTRSTEPATHFRWETANAAIYTIGGAVFIAGSMMFFPRFAALEDVGAWLFFAGSLLYVVVTAHDMAEATRYCRTLARPTLAAKLELAAATAYLTGTLLFAVGSILFLSWVDQRDGGAWCFVVGSLLFVFGACVNVLQIVEARSLVTLQLMNLTAISFVVGSLLFALASVPYLWQVETADDRHLLYSYLAWQFLIGSGLFFLGGVFNYWRALLVTRGSLLET